MIGLKKREKTFDHFKCPHSIFMAWHSPDDGINSVKDETYHISYSKQIIARDVKIGYTFNGSNSAIFSFSHPF